MPVSPCFFKLEIQERKQRRKLLKGGRRVLFVQGDIYLGEYCFWNVEFWAYLF